MTERSKETHWKDMSLGAGLALMGLFLGLGLWFAADTIANAIK